ncbi:hypothetical protein AAVH_18455 [Aphelenchoides avenae]|nr:hypothetical protein AAVH_18455 [Aphelenchus avenae]
MKQAHSTPYIRSRSSDESDPDEKENSLPNAAAELGVDDDETMYKYNGVHFNAGCSCSSTDLSNLADFYNESEDPVVTEHWMSLYQEQKDGIHAAAQAALLQSMDKHLSDSVDQLLAEYSPKRLTPEKRDTMVRCLVNRSMDRLPTIGEGFFALEKCYSADFPPSFEFPSARLARSKEMPNIADIDEYDD